MHRLTRAVLPQMLERKRGTMVVVASATSLRGRKGGVAVYGAARGAQRGYMKNVEFAPYGNINATAQTYDITIGPWSIARQRSFASEWPKTRPRAWRPVLSARKPCCSWSGSKAIFSTARSSRLRRAGRYKNRGRRTPPAYWERRRRVDCGGLGRPRWTSAIGTELPVRNARASAAIGGKADPDQTTFDNSI